MGRRFLGAGRSVIHRPLHRPHRHSGPGRLLCLLLRQAVQEVEEEEEKAEEEREEEEEERGEGGREC